MDTRESLKEVHRARMRARHFVTKAGMKVGAERHHPVACTGLAVLIRNFAWFMDLGDEQPLEERYKCDLTTLMFVAPLVNRYIDTHLIEGDLDACAALASFLSYVEDWGDFSLLFAEGV